MQPADTSSSLVTPRLAAPLPPVAAAASAVAWSLQSLLCIGVELAVAASLVCQPKHEQPCSSCASLMWLQAAGLQEHDSDELGSSSSSVLVAVYQPSLGPAAPTHPGPASQRPRVTVFKFGRPGWEGTAGPARLLPITYPRDIQPNLLASLATLQLLGVRLPQQRRSLSPSC